MDRDAAQRGPRGSPAAPREPHGGWNTCSSGVPKRETSAVRLGLVVAGPVRYRVVRAASRSTPPALLPPAAVRLTRSGQVRPSGDEALAASQGDGLEPRVHTERTQHVPNVVADRLGAQVELVGDLFRRAAVLEETQDLVLARRQMRMRDRGRLDVVDHLAE